MSRLTVIVFFVVVIIAMVTATNWLDNLKSNVEESYELIQHSPYSIASATTEGVDVLYRVSKKMLGLMFRLVLYCIGWVLFGASFSDNRAPVTMPEICGRETMSRIIGGKVAPSAPWIVSLRTWKKHTCGGALITARHVLTAAHCVKSWQKFPRVLKIGLGSNTLANQTLISVSKVAMNVNFTKNKESPLDGDIAILTLREDVKFNLQIEPICLPEFPPYVGTSAIAMGWGRTIENSPLSDPEVLQAVPVPVLPPAVCTISYGKMFTDNMICAGDVMGGRDSCQGDSGGPLVVRSDMTITQIGVVSFGKGCGRAGYPGVYTNIVNYMQWITYQIRQ